MGRKTDRYNFYKGKQYVNERLFVSLVSASPPFLEWLRNGITRVTGLRGALYCRIEATGSRAAIWILKYAKYESMRLLRWMYYAPDVPCLARKRDKALRFLSDAD